MEIKYPEKAVKQIKQIFKGNRKNAEKILRPSSFMRETRAANTTSKGFGGGMENKRLRVGEYRIIPSDEGDVMLVHEVKHRQEAYNG